MSFEEKFLIKVIKLHKYDEDYYSDVLATTQVPHNFYVENIDYFNDDYLVKYCQLEEKTIQHFIDENVISSCFPQLEKSSTVNNPQRVIF